MHTTNLGFLWSKGFATVFMAWCFTELLSTVRWQAGDIAVICNYRFAHGRPEYALDIGEERTLGVCLGPMFDRVGEMPDKW